jgi:hypothetical protein
MDPQNPTKYTPEPELINLGRGVVRHREKPSPLTGGEGEWAQKHRNPSSSINCLLLPEAFGLNPRLQLVRRRKGLWWRRVRLVRFWVVRWRERIRVVRKGFYLWKAWHFNKDLKKLKPANLTSKASEPYNSRKMNHCLSFITTKF